MALKAVADCQDQKDKASAGRQALDSEQAALQKKLKEVEQACIRKETDFCTQKEKLEAKVHNQRQVQPSAAAFALVNAIY